jgi:predicted phosphoadenosine phosphosulfate sulfurtransferase
LGYNFRSPYRLQEVLVIEAKGRKLEALLKEMRGVLVAFSRGVDSSVLPAAANKENNSFWFYRFVTSRK